MTISIISWDSFHPPHGSFRNLSLETEVSSGVVVVRVWFFGWNCLWPFVLWFSIWALWKCFIRWQICMVQDTQLNVSQSLPHLPPYLLPHSLPISHFNTQCDNLTNSAPFFSLPLSLQFTLPTDVSGKFLFLIYFIDYATTVVPSFPLCPSLPGTSSPSSNPLLSSCP